MALTRILSTRNLHIAPIRCHEALLPVLHDRSLRKSDAEYLNHASLQSPFQRTFHTSKVRYDLGEGLRGLGAGMAAVGTLGPGLGIGLIFQGFISGVARNPSTAKENLVNAFLGAALCETLGIMAVVLGFLNIFA